MGINRLLQSLGAAVTLGLAVIGCSPPGASTTVSQPSIKQQPIQPQSTQSQSARPQTVAHLEIVRLVGRHHTIIITAGPKTPLYTIATNSGQVLASNLTLEQLRQTQPDLYADVAADVEAGTVDVGHAMMLDASSGD